MPLWTPAEIATTGWWDCADIGTITPASGLVEQVADKSGNARHLVQTYGPDKFTSGSRTLNSLNVLDGDGDRFMNCNSFPVNSNGNVMVIAVCTLDAIDSVSDSVYSMDAASADWQLESYHASQFNGRLNLATFTAALSGGPFPGPSIYVTVFDFSSGVAKVFIDGTERASASYGSKINTSMLLQIFANRTGAFNPDGAFAEMVVLDAVDTNTRQLIEGYAAGPTRWNLQANLPSDHPYKSAAPTIGGEHKASNLLINLNSITLQRGA